MTPARHLVLMLATVLLLLPGTLRAQDAAVNLRRTPTVTVVERAKNAIVLITTRSTVLQRFNPFGNDPFFRPFDQARLVPNEALGSGFVLHPDGYIVTNNHVVDQAQQISVKFVDGRTFDAELLSSDPAADLAILKVKSDTPLQALELGDSSDLMIGEPVIAVGNPLGYTHSVSTGIVSAVHRNLQATRETQLEDLIQTDAAINRGNSGGPLLNAYGQVIGINTAIRGDAQNIGFAIQVNTLRDMIPDLMNPSLITKLDMPIRFKESRTIAPPARVSPTVLRSSDDAPVEMIAGIKPRDIVDAYAILLKQTGEKAFDVTLTGKPKVTIRPTATPPPEALVLARQRLGMGLEPLTPMMAGRMNLEVQSGMYVREVLHDSPADKARIQPGDVIVALGIYPVRSLEDFEKLMQYLPETGPVLVGVRRGPMFGRARLQL